MKLFLRKTNLRLQFLRHQWIIEIFNKMEEHLSFPFNGIALSHSIRQEIT